ncbi:MAG: J domain-containing protein [Clostridia bacterium]|nr:J domain-containing protein [Clostridia bacterium]
MKDPYEVLGISPNATDDEVKAAYRAAARKYHPDNYADNPLSELAQEKMQEINEAYDAIVRQRKAGYGGTRFGDIRMMIQNRRFVEAEELLDGIPASQRGAEWHYLKGQVLYQKGWLEEANRHFYQAAQMEPGNAEYRAAANRTAAARQGNYTAGGQSGGGCSACDICSALLCADCCCECMGGDLIRCC